jgi:hypothetical protein
MIRVSLQELAQMLLKISPVLLVLGFYIEAFGRVLAEKNLD